MRYLPGFSMLVAVVLGGCALAPQPPGLLIATAPPGASCLVSRQGQTIASLGPTPAIARGLEGGSGAVRIACRRPGFAETVVEVAPAFPERVDIALAPAPPRMPPPR